MVTITSLDPHAGEDANATGARPSPGSTETAVALTVAGLDPSGGAGIIADVRTFGALGVHGMAVASSLTYQSTRGVTGRFDVPPEVVIRQVEEVFADRRPDALKTGVLGGADTVRQLAGFLVDNRPGALVVDPVLESGGGVALLGPGGPGALAGSLIPLATLVTPNAREVSALVGFDVFDVSDMKAAGLLVVRSGAKAVLVTGGAAEEGGGKVAADVLVHGGGVEVFTSPWIEGHRVHGTGCVLSAAITALLAKGHDLNTAVAGGREFVRRAIENAVSPGTGDPCASPVPPPAGEGAGAGR